MLVVKYESKNFFGVYEYHEDRKDNPNFEDIKKAFRFLKNDYKNAIQIDNTVLFWDNMTNFEYGTLSAKEYDGANSYKEFIWDYDGCKKNYYTIYKNVG